MLIYGGGGAWVFEGKLVFPWWFCLVISFVCMVVLGLVLLLGLSVLLVVSQSRKLQRSHKREK